MPSQLAHCNSPSYYGTATTSSGSTPINIPIAASCDMVNFNNLSSTDSIIFKMGASTVTVAFPTADTGPGTTVEGTIVGPNQWVSMGKDRAHSYIAVDSLTGNALYSVQFTHGP